MSPWASACQVFNICKQGDEIPLPAETTENIELLGVFFFFFKFFFCVCLCFILVFIFFFLLFDELLNDRSKV